MCVLRLPAVAVLLAMAGLAGCSSGGGAPPPDNSPCGAADSRVLCLQNCSIGCTTTGCGRTDIAVNEIIVLQFSEPVDPATVTTSSIRFLTPTAAQPVGQYYVNGTQVQFAPTLEFQGGQAFLGFTPGEVYTLTIPGGDGLGVVRSTSGKPFASTLTCALAVSRGIVDRNGVAPAARIVVPEPNFLGNAPRDTRIVLEFNELIDTAGFQGQSETPVKFSFRRTRVAQQGGTECDPESLSTLIPGNQVLTYDAGRDISVLSFQPSQPLPSDICVDIDITDGVRDLTNRSAQPQRLTFRTETVPLVEDRIVEGFDGPDFLDVNASAAQWTGGSAVFRRIGGDGRHGPFRLTMATASGVVGGKRLFVLNCNQTIIPLENTLSGSPVVVTDGRYFFTEMIVPADVVLRFTGNVPPVIAVAGRLEILGDIDASGESIAEPPVVPAFGAAAVGQPGGAGGILGGRGGKGGDRITGAPLSAANQGGDGENVRVPAGFAYLSTAASTGGRGSLTFPASGDASDFHFGGTSQQAAACVSAAGGGGGGGYVTAGGVGRVLSNNHTETGITNWSVGSGSTLTTLVSGQTTAEPTINPPYPWPRDRYAGLTMELRAGATVVAARTIVSHTMNGPAATSTSATFQLASPWPTVPTPANTFAILPPATSPVPPLAVAIGPVTTSGSALQLFPVPVASSRHFLIGGSGGGGSGNQGAFALRGARAWAPGSGGGGGGGVVALRVGGALVLGANGSLLARGGSAANNVSTTVGASSPQPAPAGGGSGGSLLLQAGGEVALIGLVDVRGGTGGDFDRRTPAIVGAPPVGLRLVSEGGDGSPGFIRLETAGSPTLQLLLNAQPPATAENVALLDETDAEVACRSLYYYTNVPLGPQYVRYEIRAIVDGQAVLFSDDPAVSSQPAGDAAPVRALFQCARLDPITREVQQVRPWRRSVRSGLGQTGLAADSLNSFRFHLTVNRAIATDIAVDRVVVVFRR